MPAPDELGTLFDFLPIGAYRSRQDGSVLRANPALVRFHGYASEAELLRAMQDVGRERHVDPARRDDFRRALERDGQVRGFVSEVYRHATGERVWVSENAHLVRGDDGGVLYFEGTLEEVTTRVVAERGLRESERLLREIASRVPGMVFRLHISPEGKRRFDFVSEGVRDLYGVTPADVMADGDLLRRLAHPDDLERMSKETAASRSSGLPLRSEYRAVLPDGEVRWMQLASATVPSDGPDELRLGVIVDITAQKQADLALRQSEQRWKLALEAIGDGVWDWDLRDGRETVSAQLLALYGLRPSEHNGRAEALDALTHPDDVAQMRRDRQAHLDGRQPRYMNEHRIRHRDGSWRWVLTRGTVIERDARGRPLRMIGTHTDIGERKEAEALRREHARSAEMQRAQTAFLSRVSHELRTPLNAIIGFAQLLEMDHVGSPRQQGWVGAILDSGRHLLALVNDLLDLSSAQTGQLQFSAVSIDLALRLREVWAMHAADAQRAGLHFADQLPAAGRLAVRADPTRLTQVLSNLLSNAIKYNRPGGRIEVSATAAAGWVELSVTDTGHGIDEAQLGRLFNPFERAGAQHTPVAGTGLGLALTRQLVEAMGGAVAVRSTLGEGSTFTVRLHDAGTQAVDAAAS